MTRHSALAAVGVVAAIALVAAVVLWTARPASAAGDLTVAGDVVADEQVVTAPAVTYSTADPAVGIAAATSGSAGSRPTGTSSGAMPAASRTPTASGFLSEVLVSQGMRVSKGQILARLDTTMLDLGVRQARAAANKARTDLDVIDQNIDTLDTARSKLITARAKLVKARASLEATLPVLLRKRAGLQANITALEQRLAQPGPLPPVVPPLPIVLQGMKTGLVGLDKGIAGLRAGLGKMNAGVAQMRAGLSKIDTARRQLRDARELVAISISVKDVAAALAQTRRDQATIVSPVGGLVLAAQPAGTVVMVGAPLVRIRPEGPVRVQTYLTPDQLTSVRTGTPASVTFDSNTGPALAGSVSMIGDASRFPPTAFPTAIVHMTRAVRVLVTLDGGAAAPAGTPVDVVIKTGH